MDCLVRNVTVEGAKLVFSQTVTVPDQFDLYVRKKEQSFQARIAWRRDDEIGVALLPQRPSVATRSTSPVASETAKPKIWP
jgi:hypothetical protein